MTPEEAPVGTVVRLGHPANNILAQKTMDGTWRYLVPSRREVPYDDIHKMASKI